jgi:hypothetical protein
MARSASCSMVCIYACMYSEVMECPDGKKRKLFYGMYVYVCMCVYIYIYIYIYYIHTHTYTGIHVVNAYINAYTHIYIHTFSRSKCIHTTYIHTRIHAYTCMSNDTTTENYSGCVYVCVYVNISKFSHSFIHIHTYTHTNIHTYIHRHEQ